jgi:hypothetical protein
MNEALNFSTLRRCADEHAVGVVHRSDLLWPALALCPGQREFEI